MAEKNVLLTEAEIAEYRQLKATKEKHAQAVKENQEKRASVYQAIATYYTQHADEKNKLVAEVEKLTGFKVSNFSLFKL